MIFKFIEIYGAESLVNFLAVRAIIILVCWALAFTGTLIDFWSGTSTAKALGEKICSKSFRHTITKDAEYMRLLLFGLLFDIIGLGFVPVYTLPYFTILCTIAILSIEAKSVIENSKRRKSHAADIPEVVRQLVQAGTASKVQKILESIELITKEPVVNENSN